MNNIKLLLTLTFLLSLFSGCGLMSTTKPIDHETITVKEIISKLRDNKNRLSTMEAEARIAIDTKEMAQMGSSYIRIEMPYSIEMSIRGPLGIPLVEMKADSGHYSIRDFLRQEFMEGTPDDLNFMGLPFNAGLNEFLELMLGVVTFTDTDIDSLVEYRIDDGKYYFEIIKHGMKTANWVDKDDLILTRQVISFLNADYTIEKRFEIIETVNGVKLPRIVHIFSEELGGSISIEYTDRKVNLAIEEVSNEINN